MTLSSPGLSDGGNGADILSGGLGADLLDGGKGDDQCEPEPGRVACEIDLESGDPSQTVISRSYAPDGLLAQVAVTNPDGSVDVYELLWDRAVPIPQVVTMSVNGETTSFTYGVRRTQAIDSMGVWCRRLTIRC